MATSEGFLLVDKPAGLSSHDVVAKVRRARGGMRAGHTGTLDPVATGLLLVALGRATRLIRFVPSEPKVYQATILFGSATDTDDGTGNEVARGPVPDDATVRAGIRALTGALSSEVGRLAEQTFGVDTFQLTPSLVDPNAQSSRLDPAARLTIGKRLSERIYLTYSRSLSSSTRDQIILLEYDQTDRFSWILSRNEDRTYALDVRVRHAF